MKILLLAFFGLLLVSSCHDAVNVTSIIVVPSSSGAAVGSAQQLTAIVSPEDASDKEVVWISSDPSKATVNSAGFVIGVEKGVVTIIAAAKDGSNVQGTVAIRITAKAVSVSVTPAEPSVGVGESLTLPAAVLPEDADQAVTWTTSDPAKVAIDPAGTVTGVAKGTALITAATADGSNIKGTVTVNVTVKATSVTITPAEPSVGVGESLTLAAAVLPDDAAQAVTWTTSDPAKAAIDPAGTVTGVAKGTALITAATADGSNIKGTVTVNVTVKATSVTISPTEPSVGVGESLTLAAAVLPDDADQAVTWTTSDPAKAAIDPAGTVTGVAKGTALITAATADGSNIKGTVTINIIAPKANSITATPVNSSVGVGENFTLTAVVLPADAAQAVSWTSSAPTIATIDPATSTVTGVTPASTAITATATDGSRVTGTATLAVTARRATSITINPPSPSVGVGENLTLTAVVLPADAAQAVSWTSSAPTIATIDPATSTVTGVTPASTAITATATDGSRVT